MGNLLLQWTVPLALLRNYTASLPVPGITYIHNSLMGVPVPFTTHAIEVQSEIFECFYVRNGEKTKLIAVLEKNFQQHTHIRFKNIKRLGVDGEVVVRIITKNVVNRDGLYYDIVYSIVNPFREIVSLEILASVHFASNIKSYSFTPKIIDAANGKWLDTITSGKVWRDHDIIYYELYDHLFDLKQEIDMKFVGSRIWPYINNKVFWVIILIIAILIALSSIIQLFTGPDVNPTLK